ncbi:MAG TPA: pyridoxamine 5'-phosphate oxidase family protein [Thermoleophilaceae bacterium]|nr:pyridoxamine 5'-phosphate oxidase family protein [Thermoleophilaceae bacterium]
MPSRRDQIKMSDDEVAAFLVEQMVMQCATIGPQGLPHMVALWYVPDGIELRGWTYAKSQKAKNLERAPRATLGIADGVQYHELRGVMLECDVELEREPERVAEYGFALVDRYAEGSPEAKEAFREQARKRVGLHFLPKRLVSWDHRKLGGVY